MPRSVNILLGMKESSKKDTEAKCGEGQCGGDGKNIPKRKK